MLCSKIELDFQVTRVTLTHVGDKLYIIFMLSTMKINFTVHISFYSKLYRKLCIIKHINFENKWKLIHSM